MWLCWLGQTKNGKRIVAQSLGCKSALHSLMENDMLKAQSKVVDFLWQSRSFIYPPAFFDIMIHLVIHLPLEALEGGPIRPRWMFPFERFMKKLKGYVRNKAKPEGSIAEGYVAEEALTFSSHYFRDVTTKFNRPDRNVDPPPPTCQFQVFRSLCKSIGLRSVIRFDAQCEESDMEDPDVIHFDNSSDLPLSTSLNDLDNATLHIDGQSTEGCTLPPNIIDLDEDDDIIDDEDALPHDLADSDDEDLVNVEDDDGVEVDVSICCTGPRRNGGGDIVPLHYHILPVAGVCFANEAPIKANLGGRKADRLHTRPGDRYIGVKEITDDEGTRPPPSIVFEWDDKKTMMPLGEHASHWSNYLGELIREMPLYYPSWQKVPAERKAAIMTKIRRPVDDHLICNPRAWAILMRASSSISKSCTIPIRLISRQRSLGKVARERIPGELSPSNYPGRHVARDEYPQRHVAREGVEMSLGIVMDLSDIEVPRVFVTCRSNENENIPLCYHILDNFTIQFGREEFCLVSGLKFGVENSADFNKAKEPIPFRRRVFSSDLDGGPIKGKDVELLIESDVFKKLDDNDAVSLCCVGIVQLVLLGVEDRRPVPNWILRLANDRVGWDNYPWGSYVWPKLYKNLRDANVKRWQPLYVSGPTNESNTKTYSIERFAWAFKTWILESFRAATDEYYTRYRRHPRIVAWSSKHKFYRHMLKPMLHVSQLPVERLVPDEIEARSRWWVLSIFTENLNHVSHCYVKVLYLRDLSDEYEDEKNEFDDVVDDNPQTNYQNWQKYMSFKPDIPDTPLYKSKPMISKDYKKETKVKVGNIFDNNEALDLAIRLKALDEGYQFLNDRSAPERCGTLKGSIQGNKSDSCRHGWKQPNCANCFWYMQRGNRHAAIALAVQNEFPLAYHVVCCRHLMMNLSLKRDKTKALFYKICKAYTTEEFSSSKSHLHDIQPDAYDKLCQVGPQRWKLLVLKLAETYRAMVQDWYYKRRQLAGLVPLADALQDRNMLLTYAQSHQNRLHVYVSRVEISPLVVADHHKDEGSKKEKHGKPSYMISYLTRKISRRFTTLYYTLPPNNTLSGLKQIKNDYDTNVMYDIAKVAGKIQLFVSHHQIDLSTVLIPNDGSLEEAFAAHYKLQIYIDHLGVDFIIAKYIFPNASLAEMMNHVITNYTSDSEDNKREVTQNDYTFNQMVEWAEQEHYEDEETKLSCPKIDLTTSMADSANDARKTIVANLQRELEAEATLANTMLGNLTRYFEQMRIREIQITMLQNMPTMSLNSYGLHALLMTHEADIRTTNNLIRARQELLRSIAEKQNFINSYRAI
ncbi:phospholipase-like protein [Tanacetum coccineum]